MKIKHIALALLITNSTIYAQSIQEPMETKLTKVYNEAIAYYQKNDFKNAYEKFHQYEQLKTLNHKENFMYARSAFEIGLFSEALITYERVLFERPDDLRVQLEIGQCYFRLKRYTEAKKIFEKLFREETIPSNVKTNIELTLKAIKKLDTKHTVVTTLGFGVTRDSNIDNSADAGDFNILVNGSNTTLNNSGIKKTDTAKEYILALNHTYKINSESIFENKVVVYSQNYDKYNEKDIDALSFEFMKTKFAQKHKISYGFGFDKVFTASKSYLNVYNANGRYDRAISDNILYQGQVKISRKDFIQENNKDLNAYTKEIKNTLNFKTDNFGINKLDLTLASDTNRQGSRTDVNREIYTLSYTNSYELPKSFNLNTSILYSKISYKDTDVSFATAREDDKKELSIGLTKPITKQLSTVTSYKVIDSKSNQSPFDYRKNVFKFNLFYTF